MKRLLLVNFPVLVKSTIICLMVAMPLLSARGQVCLSPNIPNFDGHSTAYISKGNQGAVNWVSTTGTSIWNRCIASGQPDFNIAPLNTPDPNFNANNVYIEIRAGDSVYVPFLRLQNRFTLVVCGHLTLGTLELAGGDLEGLNRVRIVVCPGGSFRLDRLSAQNNVTLQIDGVLTVNRIEGQSSGLCIFSPAGTGVILNQSGGVPFVSDRWRFGSTPENCTSTLPSDGGVVLPIELLAFTARVNPSGVVLSWTTATEINNDYFTIERSNDLIMWEVLGFVGGSGTTSRAVSYSFADTQPLAGIGYYRMKQTDFDGQYKHYGPLAAHFDLGLEGLEFRVIRQFSHWMIAVPDDGTYIVEVYNLQGRKLISRQTQNLLSIEAPNEPVIIRVTDGLSRTASQVFLK